MFSHLDQDWNIRTEVGGEVANPGLKTSEKNQRLNSTYQIMANDLKAAAQMQQSLLPQGQLNIYNVKFYQCVR